MSGKLILIRLILFGKLDLFYYQNKGAFGVQYIYNSGTSCQKFCVIFKYMPTIRYIESTRCCRCLGVQCKVCLHVIRWKFACKNNDCLGLHCTKMVIMHATHWIGGQQQITAIMLGLPIYSIMSTRYTRELASCDTLRALRGQGWQEPFWCSSLLS